MNRRLSEKWAGINVNAIGIFYILSGIWEYLLGLTQLESTPSGVYFLLDIYRSYLSILGIITILVGFVFLFRINFARLLVLLLAWWSLFTSPLLGIWFEIYTSLIIKQGAIESFWGFIVSEILIILLLSLARIYIIYMLRVPKAGYIFLKEKT